MISSLPKCHLSVTYVILRLLSFFQFSLIQKVSGRGDFFTFKVNGSLTAAMQQIYLELNKIYILILFIPAAAKASTPKSRTFKTSGTDNCELVVVT